MCINIQLVLKTTEIAIWKYKFISLFIFLVIIMNKIYILGYLEIIQPIGDQIMKIFGILPFKIFSLFFYLIFTRKVLEKGKNWRNSTKLFKQTNLHEQFIKIILPLLIFNINKYIDMQNKPELQTKRLNKLQYHLLHLDPISMDFFGQLVLDVSMKS